MKGDQDKDESFGGVYVQLENRDPSLPISSIHTWCVYSYYRNKILNFLRDTLQLDDWEGDIGSVDDVEKAFQRTILFEKSRKYS